MNLNELRRKRNAAVKARNASRTNASRKTYRNRMTARQAAGANKSAVARSRVRAMRANKNKKSNNKPKPKSKSYFLF